MSLQKTNRHEYTPYPFDNGTCSACGGHRLNALHRPKPKPRVERLQGKIALAVDSLEAAEAILARAQNKWQKYRAQVRRLEAELDRELARK